jgi:hypothetical protein
MDLNDYSSEDLIKSLLAENAKALAEVKSIQGDLDKINSRLRFALAVINILTKRKD